MLSPPHTPLPQVLKTLEEVMMELTVVTATGIYWTPVVCQALWGAPHARSHLLLELLL